MRSSSVRGMAGSNGFVLFRGTRWRSQIFNRISKLIDPVQRDIIGECKSENKNGKRRENTQVCIFNCLIFFFA